MFLIAAALFASVLSPASASYDPIGSGKTTITLDKRFLAFLKAHDVSLTAKSNATRRGPKLTLPVSGGELDPTIGKGTLDHEGTLIFRRGRRSLPLREIELKVKREPLVAKVGGSQLKLAKAMSTATMRAGFGATITSTGLSLSAKLATRLNKKLGLRGRPFAAGQPFASLKSKAEPLTVAVLPQGRATLSLDPALVAKLNSLFVSINPIFPAELSPGAHFSVPIAAGSALAPDASTGTLRTAGAIEFLQQGAGQVFLGELWFEMGSRTTLAELDIEPTPTFRGKLGQQPGLAIGGGAARDDPGPRTIGLSAVPLTLSAATAGCFNEGLADGKPTFSPGEPFGTLTFTAQAQ